MGALSTSSEHVPRACAFETCSPVVRLLLFLCAGVLALCFPDTGWTEDGTWLRIPAPAGIQNHTAIYDPIQKRMVVFGGSGDGYSNEVLSLSLEGPPSVTPIETAGGPPRPRRGHTAVYDPVRQRMLVFGGAAPDLLNDVWELSLAGTGTPTWSLLTYSQYPPSPRNGASAMYDPVRDQMLIFGGYQGAYPPLNDVWSLDLSETPPTWREIMVPGFRPSVRHQHSAIYDPTADRMVVFGGLGSTYRNDVWALALSGPPTWTQTTPAVAGPSERWDHTAIYDPVRGRMIIYGGFESTTSPFCDDVWALTLDGVPGWNPVTTSGEAPAARYGHAAIYDPVADRMVVMGGNGGYSTADRNDAWALNLAVGPTWNSLVPATTPPGGRRGHTAVWDPDNDRMLIFGGYDGFTYDNVLAAMTLEESPVWNELHPAGTPPLPRSEHAAAYDSQGHRMLVFGGQNNAVWFNDVSELSLVEPMAWSEVMTVGTPPSARQGHSIVYDPLRNRLLVFGGYGSPGMRHNDVWALSLSEPPVWTPMAVTGTPPVGRHDHSAVYDPVRDRMLVFGGYGGDKFFPMLDDLWSLDLSGVPNWSPISTLGQTPEARSRHTAIYDGARDRMVIFGGDINVYPYVVGDVHALELAAVPTWTPLDPEGTPPSARANHTSIYDPMRNQMLTFSGSGGGRELWALLWSSIVGVSSGGEVATTKPLRLIVEPNPVSSSAEFSFDGSIGNSTLEIFDPQGRLIDRLHPLEQKVRWTPSGSWPRGVYFARLRGTGVSETVKFLVIR